MKVIHEAARPGLATTDRPRTWNSRIIEGDRWGSSGYYSREVLERDGPATWPAGTPVYFDHPTLTEDAERPARSVKDLAGKIVTTPVYAGDGLYADIEFYPHTAPIAEALADDVGLSIRASAEVESGDREGRTGWVITALSEGQSVDLVTRAGAGGKLVSLIESARAQAEAVEALPGGMTYDQVRAALRDAVKTHGGGTYQWIEDFTDTDVIFQIEDEDQPTRFYRQAYTLTDGVVALTGDRVEVRPRTIYEPLPAAADESAAPEDVPADPAGRTITATESMKEDSMATIQIEETEHRSLVEKAGRVDALETQLADVTEERNKAVTAVVEAHKAEDKAKAESIIAAAEGYVFNDLETAGLLAALPQVDETGRLDVAAFTTTVTEAAARRAAEAGAGSPFGVGTRTSTGDMTVDQFDKALAAIKEGA